MRTRNVSEYMLVLALCLVNAVDRLNFSKVNLSLFLREIFNFKYKQYDFKLFPKHVSDELAILYARLLLLMVMY